MTAAESVRRKLGRYEIVAEIARGGMGTVYLARLEGVAGFQRLFAIKLLHQHLADEERFVSMLLDEARLAARLHHPNAVGIVDVSDSNLGYYLVMEYVDGFTLDRLMRKLEDDPDARTRLGLRVLLDAANGLDAAHRLKDDDGAPLGIVHRDVSPQNILVGTDGMGRITDFGVARAAARITASRPGMIKGKPCYMAPEQARGDDELDARADVFALGIILWEVLTGKMLFQSSNGGAAVALMQVATMEIKRPSEVVENVPKALDDVCIKALTRDLDERYQSARELAKAVEEAARSTGWLADTHSVADAIRDLFEKEIQIRQKAINTHTAALGRSSQPMLASDIYDVPRLKAQRLSAADRTSAATPSSKGEAWHETPADHLADTPASTPAVSTTPMITPPPGAEPKRSLLLVGVLVALVGAGLLGTAFVVLQGDQQAEEERMEAERAAEAERRAEAEERAAAAEQRASEAEQERQAEEQAREEAERARAEIERQAAERAAAEREAAELAASMEGSMRASMRTSMNSMSSMNSSSTGESMETMDTSMDPAFENNPYLNR